MKVYVLFQTDIWKTKSSRVFFGAFQCRTTAIDAAEKNGLVTYNSDIEIIECELGKFKEL